MASPRHASNRAHGCAHCGPGRGSHPGGTRDFTGGMGFIPRFRGPLQTGIDILLGHGRPHRLQPFIGIEHGAFGRTRQV